MGGVELRRFARRLAVYQTTGAFDVKVHDPIPDHPQSDSADLGRRAALATIIDHGQRQQTPGLVGVIRHLRKSAKRRTVIVIAKRYRQAMAKLHSYAMLNLIRASWKSPIVSPNLPRLV